MAPSAEPARVPRTGTARRPRPYFEKQLPREVIECHIFKGELEAAGAELCAQQAPTHTHHAGAVGFRAHRSRSGRGCWDRGRSGAPLDPARGVGGRAVVPFRSVGPPPRASPARLCSGPIRRPAPALGCAASGVSAAQTPHCRAQGAGLQLSVPRGEGRALRVKPCWERTCRPTRARTSPALKPRQWTCGGFKPQPLGANR